MKRNIIAIDSEKIENPEVKAAISSLVDLQKETSSLSNNLTLKMQTFRSEVEAVLGKMQQTDTKLTEVITEINTQVTLMTDAAVQYQLAAQKGIEVDDKFVKSFTYVVKNAVANLKQLVDTLRTNTFAIGVKDVESGVSNMPAPQEQSSHQPALAPSTLLTSSFSGFRSLRVASHLDSQGKIINVTRKLINEKIASEEGNTLESMSKIVEELNPILQQSDTVIAKNKELMENLQEILSAVEISNMSTPVEDDAIFSPTETPPTTDEISQEESESEEDISESEVEDETSEETGEDEIPEESEKEIEESPEEIEETE